MPAAASVRSPDWAFRSRAQHANPAFGLPMAFAEIFPVGVLVSAAMLRNPRARGAG